MTNLSAFLIGIGFGSSVTGLVLNHRYALRLQSFEVRLQDLIAEQDHVMRGLHERLKPEAQP